MAVTRSAARRPPTRKPALGRRCLYPKEQGLAFENISTGPATILGFFYKPAFEQCLRFMSVREGLTA